MKVSSTVPPSFSEAVHWVRVLMPQPVAESNAPEAITFPAGSELGSGVGVGVGSGVSAGTGVSVGRSVGRAGSRLSTGGSVASGLSSPPSKKPIAHAATPAMMSSTSTNAAKTYAVCLFIDLSSYT